MDYELSVWLFTGIVFFFALWTLLRKRRLKTPTKRFGHVDRITPRCSNINKETVVTQPKKILPSYEVERPGLFVLTDGLGKGRLIVQRVQLADEDYFYPLVDQWSGVQGLNPLLSRLSCLKNDPKEGLSHNIYALNFVKADGQNVDNELEILSFSSQGLSIGEPLKEKIPSSSIDELLQQIQGATIGTDLDPAWSREYLGLEKAVARAGLLLTEEKISAWQQRLQRLKTLKEENITANSPQLEALYAALHSHRAEIDRNLLELNRMVRDSATADSVLTQAIPLIEERELVVRALFMLSLIDIASHRSYLDALHRVSLLKRYQKDFPSIHVLLKTVREVVFDDAEKNGREMNDERLAVLGQVRRDVDELLTEYEEARLRLNKEREYLQVVMDDYLIHREMPSRYAVRLDHDGLPEALLVLRQH